MTVDQHTGEAVDDRPIAVRRKRRVQTLCLNEQTTNTTTDRHQDATTAEIQTKDASPAVTPKKKRVRFSDPGPEIVPSTSTGLTPALRRHRVACSPGTKGVFKRRHSFPAKLASSVDPSAPATLQFAPLRQIIDGRLKRRLRRNHLSEEINAIEEEKNNDKRLRRDSITALRKEVEEKEERLEELNRQLDNAKQACMQTPPPDGTRGIDGDLAELDEELDQTAGRTQQQEHLNEASFTASSLNSFSGAVINNDEPETPTSTETPQHRTIIGSEASPEPDFALLHPKPPAISAGVQVSLDDRERELLEKEIEELKDALQTAIRESERTQSEHQRLFEKIQGHLQGLSSSFSENPSEIDAALDTVLTALVLAQSRAEDSQAEVATLSSNVKGLGFNGNTAAEMLKSIKDQFRQTRLELEYLQPGETVEGFENGRLLGILVERVHLLLQKIRDSEEEQDRQHRVAAVLQEQLDLADAQEKSRAARAREIAKDLNEKERSIKNLQRALEGYRTEVKSLEDLVNRLEAEHAKAIEQSRKDRDEAVADLEVKLEVEAKTKEEAIQEAQEKKALAETLQETIGRAMSIIDNLREEKDILLTAKDAIVSRFQTEAAQKDRAYEAALATSKAELENLRSEKTTLMASLSEAEISIGTLTDANTALEARLTLEIESGVRIMESMQSEMMRSLARVGELKNGYVSSKNGDAGPGIVMPATPCSLRFVTTPKKKRRPDSGIGTLEEEDEEMIDV